MANDIIRCRRSRAAEQAPKWKIGSRFFPRLSHYLRNEYNGNGPPPYAWYPALQQKLKPQLKLLFYGKQATNVAAQWSWKKVCVSGLYAVVQTQTIILRSQQRSTILSASPLRPLS